MKSEIKWRFIAVKSKYTEGEKLVDLLIIMLAASHCAFMHEVRSLMCFLFNYLARLLFDYCENAVSCDFPH